MKKIFIATLAYFIWNAIIYTAISFYNVSLSPIFWSEGSRYLMSCFGIFMGIAAPIITMLIYDEKTNNPPNQ